MLIPGLTKEKATQVNENLKQLRSNYPSLGEVLLVQDGNIYLPHEKESALTHAKALKQANFLTLPKGANVEYDPAADVKVEPVVPEAPATAAKSAAEAKPEDPKV